MTYAGFWKRAAAALIDGVVTALAGTLIGFVVNKILTAGGVTDPADLKTFANGLGFAVSYAYFAIMESSSAQATLGKIALGIIVTDVDGNRITFQRAMARYFSKIVSTLILFFGFMMAGFTQRKQALHDMMTDCLVVNRTEGGGI